MKSKLFALLAGVSLGAAIIGGVGIAQAEKPTTTTPLHRHYVEKEDGARVYVGPDVCSVPMSEQGWEAYHVKVHRGIAGDINNVQFELCE